MRAYTHAGCRYCALPANTGPTAIAFADTDVPGVAKIEDGADVRVVEGRGKAGFAFKSLKVCFSDSQFRRQNLHHDMTPQPGIDRFVNCTLSAFADFFQDAVVVQCCAYHFG